jgi:hypothetical protein
LLPWIMQGDMDGPLQPLATTSKCCGAARQSGHSLQLQNLRGANSQTADFPDIDVWPCCWRSIRLQLRRNTFGGAADFTKPAVPSVEIRHQQRNLKPVLQRPVETAGQNA